MRFIVLLLLCASLYPISAHAGPYDRTATAPWCGEFLPMITKKWVGAPHRHVHFVPKYCNKIMVDGSIETIPPGVAVLSGGVEADVTQTCVDKKCGQPLKPNMLYRVYVFKRHGVLKMNFSLTGHKEGPYGNEVNAEDPSQSFIGLVKTDKSGLIPGGMSKLGILSWFYRGATGIGHWIGPQNGAPVAESCSEQLKTVPFASVTILTFGINSTFRQGYDVPNIYATGIVTNTKVGKVAKGSVAIEWGGTAVKLIAGSPGTVEWPHFSNANAQPGTAVSFVSETHLPAPLKPKTTYYILRALDVDHFTLSDSPHGKPIAFGHAKSNVAEIVLKARRAGPYTIFTRTSEVKSGPFQSVSIGALGAEEGWITGVLMLGAPDGGCARLTNGLIYTSPHHS